MEKNLVISKEDLKDLLSINSSILVGKVMKRIEISNSTKELKAQVKELIYEEYRNLANMFDMYNKGIKFERINFIRSDKK